MRRGSPYPRRRELAIAQLLGQLAQRAPLNQDNFQFALRAPGDLGGELPDRDQHRLVFRKVVSQNKLSTLTHAATSPGMLMQSI